MLLNGDQAITVHPELLDRALPLRRLAAAATCVERGLRLLLLFRRLSHCAEVPPRVDDVDRLVPRHITHNLEGLEEAVLAVVRVARGQQPGKR